MPAPKKKAPAKKKAAPRKKPIAKKAPIRKKAPVKRKAPVKKKAATRKKAGRPSLFTQALAEKICTKLAEGMSLRAICADPAMPHRETVNTWLNNKPAFTDQYARAREEQADHYADEIMEIADQAQHAEEAVEVSAARLRIDARKWVASKLKPKKYGDKLDVSGELITDPVAALNLARERGKLAAPK